MRRFIAGLAGLGMLVANAPALVIDIDYTYDGGYFSLNPAAKAALIQAAADVGNAITSTLTAVPGDIYNGEFGVDPMDPTRVKIDWGFDFPNPSNTAVNVTVPAFSLAANHFRLYVGAEALPAGSPELGEGSGVGFSEDVSITNATEGEFPTAMNNAVAASNAGMRRGVGPQMNLINTSSTLGGTTVNYTLQTGAIAGVVTMNSNANWHFDINTNPAPLESDFYSVALHEILHTLGVGTSFTWDSQANGTNWSGQNAMTLNGTGTNLISTDGGHIAEGTMSTSIVTGLPQEVAMDPTLTQGTRKTITQLDLAFLRDLGYTTIAVPEPATVVLLGVAALGLVMIRRRA
ncbi:MAG: PEP-CTERM sorting domain-containing protein [Terrimicrobiaceae bacterium]|nr:PEP-CTERM sorting domain-containing protein [Terrimicrobiaceae bacterium]